MSVPSLDVTMTDILSPIEGRLASLEKESAGQTNYINDRTKMLHDALDSTERRMSDEQARTQSAVDEMDARLTEMAKALMVMHSHLAASIQRSDDVGADASALRESIVTALETWTQLGSGLATSRPTQQNGRH